MANMISNTRRAFSPLKSLTRETDDVRLLPAEIKEPDFIAARVRIFDFRLRRFTLMDLRIQRNLDGNWSTEIRRQEFDEFAGVEDLLQAGAAPQVSQVIHMNVHLAFSGKHLTFSNTDVRTDQNRLTANCIQQMLDPRPPSPRLKFFKHLIALRHSRHNGTHPILSKA